MRLDDDLTAQVDAASSGAGLSRSAFMRRALVDAVAATGNRAIERSGEDCERVRVTFRLGRKQHRALGEDAAQQHLLPSDIVRELVHARYYDGGEKALFYGEAARKEAFGIRAEINAVGRNVNNAARRLMSAVNDGDPREMIERAEGLDAMRESIMAVVERGQEAIERMAAADYQFWRSVK